MTRPSAERVEEIRSQSSSNQCVYVGRCNSSRCPKHGGQAIAVLDLLAEIDALRAELKEADEAHAADWQRLTNLVHKHEEAAEAQPALLLAVAEATREAFYEVVERRHKGCSKCGDEMGMKACREVRIFAAEVNLNEIVERVTGRRA